jgi:hypothetical protein
MPVRAIVHSTIAASIGLAILAALCAAHQAGQPTTSSAVELSISGAGLTTTHVGLDKLASLPRATLKVKEKQDNVENTYEGVRMADILSQAGMKFGQSLRGARLADYLLAEDPKGYRVVFALTELDGEFSDRVVLIANRRDGAPIAPPEGPLRIIVSDEHKHARWLRNVAKLTILSAPNH